MVIASQEDLVFSAVLLPLLSDLFHSLSNSQNCLLFQEKGSEQEMYSSPALRLLFYTRLLFNLLPQ